MSVTLSARPCTVLITGRHRRDHRTTRVGPITARGPLRSVARTDAAVNSRGHLHMCFARCNIKRAGAPVCPSDRYTERCARQRRRDGRSVIPRAGAGAGAGRQERCRGRTGGPRGRQNAAETDPVTPVSQSRDGAIRHVTRLASERPRGAFSLASPDLQLRTEASAS